MKKYALIREDKIAEVVSRQVAEDIAEMLNQNLAEEYRELIKFSIKEI